MKVQVLIVPCIGCLAIVTLYRYFNPFQSKRGSKKKQNIDRNNGRSNWQTLPHDVMEIILQRLNLGDRIRLSVVCKSWQSVVMRRDICGAPQLPWLVVSHHDQLSNCNDYLSFSSLSEGKVGKLKLPKAVRGGWFFGSSKGWLIMVQEEGLNSKFFLFNPISGVQHQLPSLGTIPTFQEFVKTTDWECHGALKFCNQVVLSTSDINSEYCMVGAIFNGVLGLCSPGDKTWSVFQLLDDHDEEEFISDILFSSSGMLYALVDLSCVSDDQNGLVASARTLNFGDDHALELKLIYSKIEEDWADVNERFEHQDLYEVRLNTTYSHYLLESKTSNEVLVVQQVFDLFLKRGEYIEENHHDEDDNHHNEEDDIDEDGGGEAGNGDGPDGYIHFLDLEDMQSGTSYARTSLFRVFKVDPETGSFLIRVPALGDQLLFLAHCGSFSLPTSDFRELQGNCIFFAKNRSLGFRSLEPFNCREVGVFYLDTGRIERSFPSSILSLRSKLTWFSPTL